MFSFVSFHVSCANSLIYLLKAISSTCPDILEMLIKSGADPNQRGLDGLTPLMEGKDVWYIYTQLWELYIKFFLFK